MVFSIYTPPMKFFLDTANLKEIEEASSWGLLDGITTNPTLLSREGKVSPEKHLKAIAGLVNGPVSMEVVSVESKGMIEEGKRYAKWAKNIVVKVPMTKEGLKAVVALKKLGIPTNVTLVFSANQALLAAKAGASYVSPFVGRLDDMGEDGMTLISEIMDIFNNYGFDAEVIVASVRHPKHVKESALLGADICTVPFTVYEKLFAHPLTDKGLETFLKDWKSTQK